MDKEKFYVTLDQGALGLSDIKVDDNTIQYEIIVSPSERHELETELDAIEAHDMDGQDMITFFDEKQADRDKEATEEEIGKLYKLIYKYGTKETRSFIEQLRDQ